MNNLHHLCHKYIQGMKFNKLTFIRFTEPKIRPCGTKRVMAEFMCDCGDVSIKAYSSVKHGGIKMCRHCGYKQSGQSKSTHGLCKHHLYAKYRDMINRCENPKVDRYHCYGGLGIKVCDEWRKDFKVFYDWCMANNWVKGLTLDRKDVNGNYCPENCRLIPMREQHFNKRNTFYVDVNGEKVSVTKLLYYNDKMRLYRNIHDGVTKGKSIQYYIGKHNLKIPPRDYIAE